jgi:molybdenum cofactor guanylyltransferase
VTDVTLAILAGGEGSRMGKAKGLLTLAGVPILEFLLDRFQWRGKTMLVTAPGREHPPGWERFTREWVDPVPGLGPLRGILTALEHAETSIILFATVDMPNITPIQLEWVVQQISQTKNTMGLMTRRITSGKEQIEPFPSAFRTTAADTLSGRLQKGSRSVYSLKDQPGFAVVPAPKNWPQTTWINLNDPEEFDTFTQSMPPVDSDP